LVNLFFFRMDDNNPIKTVELTAQECQAVIYLFNLAVTNPAGGLKVAGAASTLAGKFADEQPAPEEQEE